MIPGIVRLKLAIVRQARWLMIALALLSLVTIVGTGYTVANPPTKTVESQVHQQTVTTSVDTVAVVTEPGSLWTVGTRLENRPFYPLSGAPNATFRVTTAAPQADELRVHHRLTLVFFAERDGAEIWRTERPILDESTRIRGQPATSAVTLHIPALIEEMAGYNQKLKGVDTTDALLRLNSTYATDRYEGSFTSSSTFRIEQPGYWLESSLDSDRSHSTTVTNKVEDPPEDIWVGAGVVVGLLAGLGAAGVNRYRRQVNPVELKHHLDRQRFDEWISRGRIRQPIGGQDVAMISLHDLVDVGIDSKERVIYDPDRELYAIMNDGMMYYFDPRETEADLSEAEDITQLFTTDGQPRLQSDSDPQPATDRADPADTDGHQAWDELMEEQ